MPDDPRVNPNVPPGNKQSTSQGITTMSRLLVALALLAALWSAPASAQSRSQLGPLCTTETTPADQMVDACSKIIAAGDRLFLARGGLEQER